MLLIHYHHVSHQSTSRITSLTYVDRGQGLNHCIADVKNFVQAMIEVKADKATLGEAVSVYDAELVKRGSEEVEISRKNALLVHDFEKFMDSPVLKQGYAKAKAKVAAAT
jgi:hypothetical protein